jgi:hypothetical protein
VSEIALNPALLPEEQIADDFAETRNGALGIYYRVSRPVLESVQKRTCAAVGREGGRLLIDLMTHGGVARLMQDDSVPSGVVRVAETVELPDGRRAPVELVGRVAAIHSDAMIVQGQHPRSPATLSSGDEIVLRYDVTPGTRWRTGTARVQAASGVTVRIDQHAIIARAVGDYVYRIGKPLTPSLDERVTAIERLLGLVADDLEVAVDAELAGQRDEAAQLRLRALARIRETAQWGRTST